MLNKFMKESIADFFDPGDFAEFIGISTEQLIDAFEDEVIEALPDLAEMMGLHTIGDAEEEE